MNILSPASHLRNIKPIWVGELNSAALRLIQLCFFQEKT